MNKLFSLFDLQIGYWHDLMGQANFGLTRMSSGGGLLPYMVWSLNYIRRTIE